VILLILTAILTLVNIIYRRYEFWSKIETTENREGFALKVLEKMPIMKGSLELWAWFYLKKT